MVLQRPVEFLQYCSACYQKLLTQFGMCPSMSRKGKPYIHKIQDTPITQKKGLAPASPF
jgi:hypothetical protein